MHEGSLVIVFHIHSLDDCWIDFHSHSLSKEEITKQFEDLKNELSQLRVAKASGWSRRPVKACQDVSCCHFDDSERLWSTFQQSHPEITCSSRHCLQPTATSTVSDLTRVLTPVCDARKP